MGFVTKLENSSQHLTDTGERRACPPCKERQDGRASFSVWLYRRNLLSAVCREHRFFLTEVEAKGSKKKRATGRIWSEGQAFFGENERAKKHEGGRSEPEHMCSICFDDECTDPSVSLACGHSFHAPCIVRWLQGGNTRCPLCRHTPVAEGVGEGRSQVGEEEEEEEEWWNAMRETKNEYREAGRNAWGDAAAVPKRYKRPILCHANAVRKLMLRRSSLSRERSNLKRSKEYRALVLKMKQLNKGLLTTDVQIFKRKNKVRVWSSRLGESTTPCFKLGDQLLTWSSLASMKRRGEIGEDTSIGHTRLPSLQYKNMEKVLQILKLC